MKAAIAASGGRSSEFARWAETHLKPFYDDHRWELERWAFDVRKNPDSNVTWYVEALDRTNFLGLIDREATHEEFACLLLLKRVVRSPMSRERFAAGVAIHEVIDAVAKTVRKARKKYGRPYHIREVRKYLEEKERQDPRGNLRRMREGTRVLPLGPEPEPEVIDRL